jgi:holo-[acyl-carrier protein] synthase
LRSILRRRMADSFGIGTTLQTMIIGIGIDHVEIQDFRPRVKVKTGRFVQRVFTDSEVSYAKNTDDFVQRLAARFAAKEAVLKALGTGWTDDVEWREIEITNNALGQPEVLLSGKTAKIAARLRARRVFVSMSHTRNLATAQVVIEGTGRQASVAKSKVKSSRRGLRRGR